MGATPEGSQVCVVGAGAAGAVVATELARQGIEVLVLESGPRHDPERRAEYSRRFLRGDNPWRTPNAALDRYTTGGTLPYRLDLNRARGVGGSTLHWEGYAPRLHPDDFRLRTLHALAEDWPLSYDELEPYYGRAEAALGVAGAPGDRWSGPRSSGYPLPPFPLSYSDRIFARACEGLGVALHALPQARNSVPYAGRPQCQACATCYACPIGAKASVDLTHIPRAMATGRVTILHDTVVRRLELGPAWRVERVVCADRDGQTRRFSADVFVLAGGAVENARLLLLSAPAPFPRGLANGSGLLGRSFMSHPALDVVGRVADRVYPYRIGFSTAMSRQFVVPKDRDRHGAFLLEFLNSAGPTPARLAVDSERWGADLRARVAREFGRSLGIRVFCEQLPDAANSISLSTEARDHFGDPGPHLTYSVGRYEQETLGRARDVAERILRAAGATDIRVGRLRHAAHQIGTHRMGRDAASSVVDANLRTHDVPNLCLLGSGCFPTASASPPTLTIVALAIRAAEHIAAQLHGGGRGEAPAGARRAAG